MKLSAVAVAAPAVVLAAMMPAIADGFSTAPIPRRSPQVQVAASAKTIHGGRNSASPLTQLQQSAASVAELPEGMLKTVSQPGDGEAVQLGDITTVKYTCYLPTESNADFQPPFAKSDRQKVVIGDGTMIPGWDKALRTMRVGERAVIRVTDPSLGYGDAGFPPLIPAQSQLEFDVEVLDTQSSATNIDFDSLASAGSIPTTAAEIAAAYETRQAEKASLGPKKEGLEGFIEKAKNFYFFGLFEGETGQQAPWFLRPSITFPIAFLIVGATFYVSFATGSIKERGASVKDELDELITTIDSSANTRYLASTSDGRMISSQSDVFSQYIAASTEQLQTTTTLL